MASVKTHRPMPPLPSVLPLSHPLNTRPGTSTSSVTACRTTVGRGASAVMAVFGRGAISVRLPSLAPSLHARRRTRAERERRGVPGAPGCFFFGCLLQTLSGE